MRTKLVLLLAFLFALVANAETVYFDLAVPYFNANPATNRVVTLQPLSPFPGNFLRYTSSVSGTFYASNLYIGDYAGVVLQKGQAGQIPFQITVVSNGTTVVNAHEITSVLGQQSYPISGKSSWSINASDQRYLRTASVGSTDYVSPGQSTSVRTNGTVFSVDVTGSLTNNAATATFATNAANSTNLFGVAYNSGATNLTSTNTVLKGTTEFRTPDGNDVITADFINDADNHLLSFDFSPGSSVLIGGTGVVATAFHGNATTATLSTNAINSTNNYGNSATATLARNVVGFSNIMEMVASPYTNGVKFVSGYWGSNSYGNGWFRHSTNATTTNYGTVFESAYGGCWLRLRDNKTNQFYATWFGVRPMNTDSLATFHDSYERLTNCFATAGNFSEVILPPFGLSVSQGIVATNWISRTLSGSRTAHGTWLAYPNLSSWLAYSGPSGTNTALLRMWSAYNCTLRDFALETSTPIGSSSGHLVTNNAQVALDVDQANPNYVICTGNVFENMLFRTRGTNVYWQGLRISSSSPNNCENFLMRNLKFQGNGNVDFSATGNAGEAILIGPSANARGHVFDGIEASAHPRILVVSNGGFTFRNALLTSTTTDFLINSWVAQALVEDVFTENGRQAFLIGAGAGASGGTLPLTISRYHNTSSTSGANGDTNTPLIQVYGSANLKIQDSCFYAHTNQLIFWVTNTASAFLTSERNAYGPVAGPPLMERMRLYEFLGGSSIGDQPAFNSAQALRWGGSGSQGYRFEILDKDGNTNRTLFKTTEGRLTLAPYGSSVVQIGQVPSPLANDHLAVHPTNVTVRFSFGDDTVPQRVVFSDGGNSGDSLLTVNSTNSRSAVITLNQGTSQQLKFLSGFGRNDLLFYGGPLAVKLGATALTTFSELGQITISPTNPTSGLTINSDQTIVTGRVDIAKSLLVRSNTTANWPTAPATTGAFALVNSNGVGYILESGLTTSWQSTNPIAGGGSGTPGGSDTHVQFNDGGSFGGDSGFVFNKATDALTVGQKVVVGDGSQATPPVASIAGGYYNRIVGSNDGSFVASGQGNWIDGPTNTGGTFGHNAIITGMSNYIGHFYTNTGIATFNFIGGGLMNRIIGDSSSGGSTTHGIVSGEQNLIQRTGYGFIGGGVRNRIIGSGDGDDAGFSVIGGGGDNLIQPRTGSDAQYSVIPGGIENYVGGGVSFAAGSKAGATNDWVFVWSDGTAFGSTSNKQFLVRSTGGVGINTNNPGTNSLVVLGSSHFASGSLVVSNQGEAQLFVSAAGGIGINTNNPGTNTLLVRGNIRADRIESDNQDTTILIVTNIVSPFGQLLSTGNATNYTIDFNASDKQSITATGNVAFLTINNISNGAMKRFYITNVFKATSNINVLMPTNCLVVTTNSGGPAAIGGGDSTNWVMTITNDAKLSIECHGTTMRTLVWYLRLLQP